MNRTYVWGVTGLLLVGALAGCGGDDGGGDPGERRAAEAADIIWQDTVNDGMQDRACELYEENGNVIGDERYDEFSVSNDELIDALREIVADEC